MRPARRSIPGLAVAAVLLAGCSSDRPPSSAPAATAATASAASPSSVAAASGAGVESDDLSRVIVEQTVTLPGRPSDQLRLGVQSLTVRGKVMVLRVVVTPRFGSVSRDTVLSLFEALGDDVFRPRLVDRVHLKEYSPIGDAFTWVSNSRDVRAANGSPMLAWAYLAAPQDRISAVDVRISDAWPSFTNVPISR